MEIMRTLRGWSRQILAAFVLVQVILILSPFVHPRLLVAAPSGLVASLHFSDRPASSQAPLSFHQGSHHYPENGLTIINHDPEKSWHGTHGAPPGQPPDDMPHQRHGHPADPTVDEGHHGHQHSLDCPLCLAASLPLDDWRLPTVHEQPLSRALIPIVAAHIAARTGTPLPARGPPAV